MLALLVRTIPVTVIYFIGYFIIKKLVGFKPEIKVIDYIYVIFLVLLTTILYPVKYTEIYSISVFILNIIVYKKVFKIEFSQSIIATSIMMALMAVSDVALTPLLRIIFTQTEIRENSLIMTIANALIGSISYGIINIKYILQKLQNFYKNLNYNKTLINILFLIILFIGFCNIIYNLANKLITDKEYLANTIIAMVFIIITYIYINSQNEYKKLNEKYDSLFKYVQNFEEWIEKEQINRHEYKNQLAIIRALSKEKQVIDKVDEILNDSIKVENFIINKLKVIPKGGLKGLIYYKIAVAEKRKVKLSVDVSIKDQSYFKKLSEDQIKVLCNLIGIYFDNAIEASEETKKKLILLEIYELSDRINIVISNTFNMTDNFSKRNEKGTTTKGEGHGNGLYYATNLLKKHKWIESNQEILDDLYVQKISIKKLDFH